MVRRTAHKSRPSKMGRKWTQDDIIAYNITVVYQDLMTFFGMTNLPSPDVNKAALTAQDFQDPATANDEETLRMLYSMDRMTDPDNLYRAPATICFVDNLFNVLHYGTMEQSRFSMFPVSGPQLCYIANQGRPPQMDICIMNRSDVISLVVKVNRHSRGFDPEPRLISDAIGAFHNDNLMRVTRLGTNPLTSMVMPGIVMDGSMPTFYKIPITAELVEAVEAGKQPEEETVVHAYRPEVPRPEEGMKPLDNRYIILSCFEAFRQFVF